MSGHPIRRSVAVLSAAALSASLATVSLTTFATGSDTEPAQALPLIKCDGKVATKIGTPGRDVIRGTAGRDIIAGLGGNDIILGKGGNDLICGGPGNDRLVGGAGHDKILGQTGRDRLFGQAGIDQLFGGLHNDFLAGQAGPDFLFGGPGFDQLDGGIGTDTCYQGLGHGPLVRCELPKPDACTYLSDSALDGTYVSHGPVELEFVGDEEVWVSWDFKTGTAAPVVDMSVSMREGICYIDGISGMQGCKSWFEPATGIASVSWNSQGGSVAWGIDCQDGH